MDDRKIKVWLFCIFLIGVNFVLGILARNNPGVLGYGAAQLFLFMVVAIGLAVAWSEHQG